MRRRDMIEASLGLAAWALCRGAVAQSGQPRYQPPKRGAPASRVGGGTRGVGDESPRVVVLAPDHTGLTLSAQPNLYFYLTRPAKTRLEVTVINDQAVQPLLEKELASPAGPGIHRLSLREHGVTLKPGIEYRWFVGLVVDAAQRSNDVIASGTIQWMEPAPDLQRKLAAAGGRERYTLLAAEGIWYDAVDEITRAIEAYPGNAALRADRGALLEQVGLEEIARFDSAR